MNARGGDVAVIGGGLIGLAVAFELAQRGADVRVYEREEPARAASWAGAGMLGPYSEIEGDETLGELCAASLHEYPEFVARVAAASGVDARLHLDGIAHVAFDDEGLRAFGERAAALAARGVAARLLDRNALLAMEPWIGASARGALLIDGEGHVDNRRLGRALAVACSASGVSIARSALVRIECDERRVLGVHSDVGFTPAAAVVNACGAWAAAVDGVPPGSRPPVEPVKGEMLALAVPVGFVRHAARFPGACYLVPRDDGRLLVGATSVRSGFDARVTAGGVEALLRDVLAAAPALAGFTITETWAGLRPGSPDGRPFLGATPTQGLYLACGHYRNGILLTPVTARLVADAILGSGDDRALEPFSLARMPGAEAPPWARRERV